MMNRDNGYDDALDTLSEAIDAEEAHARTAMMAVFGYLSLFRIASIGEVAESTGLDEQAVRALVIPRLHGLGLVLAVDEVAGTTVLAASLASRREVPPAEFIAIASGARLP